MNISSYVSDTFARISWSAGDSQQDTQFYVAYMNNRKLSSPALSCLDAEFLKQSIKVTAESINQLQHPNCSENPGTKLLCCRITSIGVGEIVDQVKYQIISNSPTVYDVVAGQWLPLVAVFSLSLIGANNVKIPCGSLPFLPFGWCELLRVCCLCKVKVTGGFLRL